MPIDVCSETDEESDLNTEYEDSGVLGVVGGVMRHPRGHLGEEKRGDATPRYELFRPDATRPLTRCGRRQQSVPLSPTPTPSGTEVGMRHILGAAI